MEYGLRSEIKTYAGGLGILAGDYMKGVKDNDYPMIGIGLKWKQGYTGQKINENNKVVDTYANYPYDKLEDTGLTVTVEVRKRPVVCKVWKAGEAYGCKELYLLDTDVPGNQDGWISGQLYGWFGEERVAQEIVLGVGGVRLMRKLGRQIDVYHFNEGHAVLAALELVREKREKGMSFDAAVEATRKEVVFTTHTPIVQGNESHPHELLQYMGAAMGLSIEQMHSIGGTPFNMTVAALRLSRISNAVADLHRVTANDMWKHIDQASPILGVTNGIHVPTWVDAQIRENHKDPKKLWDTHMTLKRELIEFVAKRTSVRLDENKLLIGFARRAAPYKRSNLIFSSGNELLDLLKTGKIQIVFSGKAHPLDDGGKNIVEEIVRYAKEMPGSVVFLQDYDMNIGAALTRGADVWLNNPRRPLEACGTSGMKAAMNGVLNASVLDGWWPEACQHGVNGWAIGDEHVPANVEEQDARDSKFLAEVLTKEVVPLYYGNREQWIKMMQASIETVTPAFSVDRMLKEYYDKMYIAH
jgi:starch phosphorylase